MVVGFLVADSRTARRPSGSGVDVSGSSSGETTDQGSEHLEEAWRPEKEAIRVRESQVLSQDVR